jgi:hypothetical protein
MKNNVIYFDADLYTRTKTQIVSALKGLNLWIEKLEAIAPGVKLDKGKIVILLNNGMVNFTVLNDIVFDRILEQNPKI